MRTNLGLLKVVARHHDFRAGNTTIDWLERELDALLHGALRPPAEFVAAAAAFHAGRGGWIGAGTSRVWLDDGNQHVAVDLGRGIATLSGQQFRFESTSDGPECRVAIEGNGEYHATYSIQPAPHVSLESGDIYVVPPPPLPRRAHAVTAGATAIVAPLAGTIAAVRVGEGDSVATGAPLVMLEAMKMEHRIAATADGTVRAIHVAPGDVVREGDLLVELT